MNCDLLVLAPHPDDAELHAGGLIARHVRLGAAVVVVDATAGEMGSRGDAAIREREWTAAADILGLSGRANLGLRDGHLQPYSHEARQAVVEALRRFRPAQVLAIHPNTRHPDHRAIGALLPGALKAAALHKLPVSTNDAPLPSAVAWHYEGELPVTPDLLVPCTAADWAVKNAAIDCYASQLTPTKPGEPETSIGRSGFRAWIDARGQAWGWHAEAAYAEALTAVNTPACGDLRNLNPG